MSAKTVKSGAARAFTDFGKDDLFQFGRIYQKHHGPDWHLD